MRLSFNEIRARVTRFANNYADATYEKGETQTFYSDFFQIFGVQRRSVARYEEHVKKLNNRTGFIDLFWPHIKDGKVAILSSRGGLPSAQHPFRKRDLAIG